MPLVHAYHDPFQADLPRTDDSKAADRHVLLLCCLVAGCPERAASTTYLRGGLGTPALRGILRPPFVIFPKPCFALSRS